MEDDRSYYARRAMVERRNADRAENWESRRRHLELADMLSVKSALVRPLYEAPSGP
jgi:hypothetical protein